MRLGLLEDWRTLGQLALLCQCGKAVELKRLGCCRACYDRRQHSLRFFAGLRERVIKRDGARCRACGAGARLLVHHRAMDSEERTLITLCVRCHLRVHHWRWFRHQAPLLVQLWTELHGGAPVQLQLPLESGFEKRQPGKLNAPRYEELELFATKSVAWREALWPPFGDPKSFVSQKDRF
jgi:hypothetical protein